MSKDDKKEPKNYLNATKGFKSWIFTVDHKRIGIMYLAFISFAFFFRWGVCFGVETGVVEPS